jgi:hypothetical protein
MKQKRVFAPVLPATIGLILLVWGLWVMYTAFRFGTLPLVTWTTNHNTLFGLTWFIAFFVLLLPAYAYALSLGFEALQGKSDIVSRLQRGHWLSAISVSVLLCALTFCSRVAVTSWFPSPMHPPFEDYRGGKVAGFTATFLLLLVEAGVLAGIKYQTRRQQKPFPLLLPGVFALILLAWAGWTAYAAFTAGALPVVRWQTEHRQLFGWAWMLAFFIALLPAYLYAISLGILGLVERTTKDSPASVNFWLVAIGIMALLCLVTFAVRVAVTAWFPEPMHPPLGHFDGGLPAGCIATAVLGVVMVSFYRVARSF